MNVVAYEEWLVRLQIKREQPIAEGLNLASSWHSLHFYTKCELFVTFLRLKI